MAEESMPTSSAVEGDGTAAGPAVRGQQPGALRILRVLLRLLAVLVFAQPVFAGLFLDGQGAWREWHSVNGMAVIPLLTLAAVILAVVVWRSAGGHGGLALASAALLVAVVAQNIMGNTGTLPVHIPLGVAILGLIGTLLNRTRA